MVVNPVVPGHLPHPVEQDRRNVTLRPPALPGKMAILNNMPARCEGLPVAARGGDASIPGVEHITTHNPVSGATLDHHATIAKIPEDAAQDPVILTTGDLHRIPPRRLKHQPGEGNVGHTGHRDQRPAQPRYEQFPALRIRSLRWPEIKDPCVMIDVVFPGAVQFLENVQEVDALPLSESIMAIRGGGFDEVLFEIQARDSLIGICPVPGPVSMNPDVLRLLPFSGAFPGVIEPLLQLADLAPMRIPLGGGIGKPGDQFILPLIRPPRQGHRPARIKQFRMGHGGGAGKPARAEFAKVRHPKPLQIGLFHLPTRGGIQPVQNGRILHGGKPRNRHPAQQPGGSTGFPFHRMFRSAGILGGENKRIGSPVIPGCQPDGHRTAACPALAPG